MKKLSDFQDLAYLMFNETGRRGLMYHAAEDATLDGRTIEVGGRTWINFGSCSYLGLELEPALKAGVVDAVGRYGTQFSSSRAMVSAPLYAELEPLLATIFGVEPLIASSTSLGHVGAIPMIVDEADAILLDQQVHMSVETAARLARAAGAAIEVVRHNDLAMLEARVAALSRKHRKVWYMADGLYSMYGDLAPIDALVAMLDRHERLHLYVDDAHAMSWTGERGRGWALAGRPLHPRMVVATSLNKAFACAGGVVLMQDEAMRHRIKTVGGPFIYSGPIQPPMLGAAVASARLHLSDGFGALQAELRAKIRYCNDLLVARGLPLISRDETPVRFVGTGLPSVTHRVVEALQAEGLYVNAATFPVVPMKRAGVRFTITRHHGYDDLKRLADALAAHLPAALAAENSGLDEVREAFGLPAPVAVRAEATLRIAMLPALTLERHASIDALDAAEWDRLLGARGSFSAAGLRFLERTFRGTGTPENDWRFYYYMVRDAEGAPVLATFFTEAVWKDDMIASPRVSARVEARRAHDPYHLTTRTFAMGALLTEGDHLYLDRDRDWRPAFDLMMRAARADQAVAGAPMLVVRDLPADDALSALLLGQGFATFPMPESLVMDVDWADEAELVARLSRSSRRHVRTAIAPFDGAYDVELVRAGDPTDHLDWAALHALYRNVQRKGLEYNTFPLPDHFLREALRQPGWELTILRLKGEARVSAWQLAYAGPTVYAPIVAGLDYGDVERHGAYRQLLWRSLRRAKALGLAQVRLGMGAAFEKRRLGARPEHRGFWFQTSDGFQMAVLATLYGDSSGIIA